jgi:hypothetical protein
MSGKSITRTIEIVTPTRNGTLPSVEGKSSIEPDPSSAVLCLVLRQVRWATSTPERWKPGRRSDSDHASEDPHHPFNYTDAQEPIILSVMRESDYAAGAVAASRAASGDGELKNDKNRIAKRESPGRICRHMAWTCRTWTA